jgi:DNA-binding transcriptional LysR family regulator
MSLRQMEYFLTVAKEGSFSRAAAELNVTQPALSQQVIALEGELGAPLFERLGRGVRITAAGRAYLPYAEAAVTARRRGRQAVENVRAGLGGELELGTVISVGVGVLRKPLLRWHAQIPGVAILLHEFSHRRALEQFVDLGAADLAVGPTPTAWDGEAISLGHERFVLILSRCDAALERIKPYRGKPPRAAAMSVGRLPLDTLKRRQWVLFERANGLSELIEGHLASAGVVAPPVALRTSQFVAATALASGGMGPTLIPANVVPPDLPGVVCEPDPPLLRQLSAYAKSSIAGFAGRFVELVREDATMLEPQIGFSIGRRRG